MRILIVTSCTGKKTINCDKPLMKDDFAKGMDYIRSREKELKDFCCKAENLYAGQQHNKLMSGVALLRKQRPDIELDLYILSAGYGLVPCNKQLAPYECTFSSMKSQELDDWATFLNIPTDIRKILKKKYDLVLLSLGEKYLKACKLDDSVGFKSKTVIYCSSKSLKTLPQNQNIIGIPLSNKEAKRFSSGLICLKGELIFRLLSYISNSHKIDEKLFEECGKLEFYETIKPSLNDSGKRKENRVAKVNPSVDKVIEIPSEWWNSSLNKKVRFFIPDVDDLVDPDFDFINEVHSGDIGDWCNQVYAHQMFDTPNSDGILISKCVAESSAKKKERINRMGVHRFLRVPDNYPIMGDCGAFGYILLDKPPYETGEILDYYTRLGFDYGVSIDHLIVAATEQEKKYRYDLTIHNAEAFIKEHKKRGLNWTPIGAVQGWDAKSYAKAAKKYVEMGYKYLALGGLVRSQTEEILEILEEVHQFVPSTVQLHLFGIGRLDAMKEFIKLGVTSVDSASQLRRAWLSSRDNYWSLYDDSYAAIRIPEPLTSPRAKKIIKEGKATVEELTKIEQNCLKQVRDYDKGLVSIEMVLDALDEYDNLIMPENKSMRKHYQRTLAEKPWKRCPCSICQKSGVEVVIFRGNNRNRRRGFHNVYVFYKLLEKILTNTNDDGIKEAKSFVRQLKLRFDK